MYISTTIVKKEEEGKEKKKKIKRGGKDFGCGRWGLSKGEVWVVGGAYAQDPQGWKALGAVGCGLRLKEQKGPRSAPHPWSQRTGDLTWQPSRLPGLKRAGQTPSSPLLLLPDGSSHLPLLISPASLAAWMGLWRAGNWPGSSAGSPCPSGWGSRPCSSPTPPR